MSVQSSDAPGPAVKDGALKVLSVAILALGLVITWLAWRDAENDAALRAKDTFSSMVADARKQILVRMAHYEQGLWGGVALFDSTALVTRAQWRTFVDRLRIHERFPGLQGMGYSTFISSAELDNHIRTLRSEGFPDYSVRPGGERALYSSIIYLEPFNRLNQRAFGFDMYSEPVRRTAMDIAIDRGQASLSGKVTLVQEAEGERQAGTLMYLPVYARDLPVDSPAARRVAIRGFVYSPFRMNDLMAGILGNSIDTLALRIYDGNDPIPDGLMFDSHRKSPPGEIEDRFRQIETIEIANHRWTLEFRGTKKFRQSIEHSDAQTLMVSGILISTLLFAVFQGLFRSRARAVTLAREITHDLRASEARTRAIVDTVVDAIITIDSKGMVQWFTPSAERIFGWNADEVVGNNINMLMPEPFKSAHDGYLERFSRTGQARVIGIGREVVGMRKNGQTFPMELSVSELTIDGQRLFTGIVRDITERRQAEAEQRLAASVFHSTSEGIIITDTLGIILAVNQAFTDITGFESEEAVGKTPRILKSNHHEQAFYEGMWHQLNESGQWSGEIWNRRKDGDVFLERQTINMIRDDEGRPYRFVAVFSDITEMRRKDDRIRHLAFHDALTGLANRSLLNDRLEHTLTVAQRENRRVAVLFLDLDRFKAVNDTLGHDVGDQLLRTVANKLQELVRSTDTVARLGGDEFVVLLENPADENEVAHVGERIVALINQPMDFDGQPAHVGTSIGIAMFPEDGTDAITLMKGADTAMYAAKTAGKNTYRFFNSGMTEHAERQRRMELDLYQAIEEGQFQLHYQPKVMLSSGKIQGVEALIRWNRPGMGMIYPGEFIPLAEETGLILAIGEWVIREAVRFAAAHPGLKVAINVSAAQFKKGKLPELLATTLAEHGLPGSAIEIELTESTVMTNAGQGIESLQAIRHLGVAIAVDDFGTGYSSLSHLRRLPIDTLKIDQSFVMHAETNKEDAEIVRTIIALGKTLQMDVVAEGVETLGQVALLCGAACPVAQGFHFSRALTEEELGKWMSDQEMIGIP